MQNISIRPPKYYVFKGIAIEKQFVVLLLKNDGRIEKGRIVRIERDQSMAAMPMLSGCSTFPYER